MSTKICENKIGLEHMRTIYTVYLNKNELNILNHVLIYRSWAKKHTTRRWSCPGDGIDQGLLPTVRAFRAWSKLFVWRTVPRNTQDIVEGNSINSKKPCSSFACKYLKLEEKSWWTLTSFMMFPDIDPVRMYINCFCRSLLKHQTVM